MKKLNPIALAASVFMLAACGQKAPEAKFDTLEDARAQSRANAEYNAKLYRAENPRFTDHKIVSHSDPTQTPDCPQGDGWASVSIMKVEGKEIEKYIAMCSTVSPSIGCYLEKDFVKLPVAQEEGKCQPTAKVPFPLPKLGK